MTTLIQTACDTLGPGAQQEPARIILRTEAPTDLAKLDKVQPGDQVGYYRGNYQGPCLVLTKIPNPAAPPAEAPDVARQEEIAKLKAMKPADLKTLAAERGIAWDSHASKDTMAERIADAAAAVK